MTFPEAAYNAIDKAELKKYKDSFVYFSKIRRSVKIRYADIIDNAEYEKQMQNLLFVNKNIDLVADIAIEITGIAEKNDTVDWQNNQTIHNKIAQEIDDLFYAYEKEHGLKADFDTVDKIIENVITVALRRFK